MTSVNDSQKLTKVFQPDGTALSYSKAAEFTATEYQVHNLEALFHLLSKLQESTNTAIVSGNLSGQARKKKVIRRNNENLIDKQKSWICLDVDKFELPEGLDVVTDPVGCIERFIKTLSEEFHNASYIYQISSSCGLVPNLLKVHLFFWLEKPLKLAQVKEYFTDTPYIDPSIFSPSQLIYIAPPIFEDPVQNPYPNISRIGLIQTGKTASNVHLKLTKSASKSTKKTPKESHKINTLSHDKLIQELGDGTNQQGFYYPILSHIAYLCTYHWHDFIRDNIEDLKETIRTAIDNADSSSHRPDSDIKRYKSDAFLDGLFNGAFKKDFGSELRKDVDDCYQTYPINKSEATHKLIEMKSEITQALIENFMSRKGQYIDNDEGYARSFTKLLKATAGIGKTHEVINAIEPLLFIENPRNVNIEIYVPSHKLANEIVDKINNMKPLGKSPFKKKIEASLIVGRTKTKNGVDVCKRKAEVEEATGLGISVGKGLCGEHLDENHKDKCQHFNECLYQEQFQSWANHKHPQCAYVLSHDYLFIKRKESLPKPDFVVIDETFYSKGIKEIVIEEPYSIIADYKTSNVIQVIDDYSKTGHSLLKLLRDKRITVNDIRKLAPSFKRRDDDGIYKYLAFDIVLENLADEYEQFPHRDESRLLKVVKKEVNNVEKYTLVYKKRREMKIPTDVPMLMIDADGDEEISKLFRAESSFEFVLANASRNAVVHQFTDKTWYRGSLLTKETLRKQTLRFIDLVIEHKNNKVLVVMDKQVLEVFGFEKKTVTSNADNVTRYFYKGDIPVIHYGGFRGSNEYEDYDTIILIGRNEPSVTDMENQASALWFDDEEDIITIDANAKGRRNYNKKRVAYRMADGSIRPAQVSSHPDRRVDKLLKLSRDSESVQAIDRLRLVHSETTKTVWLLCNIPLDITVNHLYNWEYFNTLIEIVSTENCFVVHKNFDYFKELTQSAQSRNLQKWENMQMPNRESISDMHKISFWLSNSSEKSYQAYVWSKYAGSIKELIANSIGEKADNIEIEKVEN